ncbi:MAG: tryptophan-rich sensory protein [Micrococcaceae bacterium]|nr:tryptophan-rich sensory protein [Micrococcaceae bacterium]
MPTTTARSGTLAPLLTAAAMALAIAGAFLGSGAVVGTSVQDVADGWLSADGTILAPGSGAFSIWSIIYLGLLLYAVVQFLPSRRDDALHRKLRGWAAASGLLNALWLGVVQLGWLGVSVVVIFALLATLCVILVILRRTPESNLLDRVVLGGTFGLYLGWVSVAAVANVSALLASSGFTGFGLPVPVIAGAVLLVVAAIGVGTAVYSRGRLGPGVALAWGLGWITGGRSAGGLESTPVAVTAASAAALVLVAVVAARLVTHGPAAEVARS